MCAVQFSQQNLYMCAVWWKPGVFTQVGFTLTFPPHILYSLSVHNVGTQGRWVPLGNSLAIIKQHKTSFPGPFRIPSNILYSHFLSPHPSLYISNLKPKHLAIKVSQDGILLWLKQWPKGLPGRRRLQKQLPTMCVHLYVFAYVTLIKSTHSLTKRREGLENPSPTPKISRDPRDFPRAKPEGNLEGRGVQNPRPREISRAEGDVFPILSSLAGKYWF